MNQLAAGILATLLLLTTASSAKATQGATTPAPRRALEGYRLGEIRVSGAKSIPSEVIRQSLGLVSGEIYDESKLRTGFEELTRFYGEGGYIKFLPQPVLDVDEQRKVVNLTVNIDEGVRYFSTGLASQAIRPSLMRSFGAKSVLQKVSQSIQDSWRLRECG